MATLELVIDPFENSFLTLLGGHLDENYRVLEKRFGVEINNRANVFRVIGEQQHGEAVIEVLQQLYVGI